jgi:thiol-disulfide isomerase/thioredoxin
MKKWISISFALLFSAGFACAYILGFFAPSFSSIAQEPIQRIDLVDLAGTTHSFDDLEGNETVLYFFASWCAPCFETLTTLQQLSEENPFKVKLLAVALDSDTNGVVSMLNTTGFTGEVWLASEGIWALQKRYFGNERRALPYVVRLDENTNMLESGYGLDDAAWKAVLVNGYSINAASSL